MDINCCTFTRGEFFIRDAKEICAPGEDYLVCDPSPWPFKKIGNVSSGLIEVLGSVVGRENEFNIADPEARVEILGVNISMSINCTDRKNLIHALLADKLDDETSSRVQEFCFESLDEGDFFEFDFKGVDPASVSVYLRGSGSLDQNLEVNTDYLVNSSGIQIINPDLATQNFDHLRITYDYDTQGYYSMSFGSAIPKYKEIYFKGINVGEGNEDLFDASFYRVLFSPLGQFDLITRDEFLTINLQGSVEKRNGHWFRLVKQER